MADPRDQQQNPTDSTLENGGSAAGRDPQRAAQPQGDGDDAPREEVGRVGAPERGGEGGYGNDTGFAGGTTGSREGLGEQGGR